MRSLNSKITGGTLTAAEWNDVPSEMQNIIENLGITLSAGDLNQLGKAISGYVANGDFYTDSGAANAYVLTVVGLKQRAPSYTDGFKIRFIPGNTSTGASTVNAGSLGVKPIRHLGGNEIASGEIESLKIVDAYYDNSAGYFIIVNAQGQGSSGRRNSIINGNCQSFQEGNTNAATANTYIADMFQYNFTGLTIVDVAETSLVPNSDSSSAINLSITAPDASIAAGDHYFLQHAVEGFDAQKYGFGTSTPKALTLSFHVRAPVTGIYTVAFRNSALNRSYTAEYTINAANTYEKKTVTITADDNTGTWLTNSGAGIFVDWTLAAGSTLRTAAGAWTAGNYIASTNQVNGMAVIGDFIIAQIQLEVGSTATEFEHLPIGETKALISRYFIKTFNDSIAPAQNIESGGELSKMSGTVSAGASIVVFDWRFLVKMRSAPVVTLFNPQAANAQIRDATLGSDFSASSATNVGDNGCRISGTTPAGMGVNDTIIVHATADARL